MDIKFILELQESFILFFFVLGFTLFTYLLAYVFKNIIHYIRYKEFSMNETQRHIYSLMQENKKIKEKNVKLENQIEEITNALINNLKQG